jgi:hypothetical protein
MRSLVRISGGKMRFASPLAEQVFLEKNEGKYAYIVIDDEATAEKRRFFEGACVPAFFYLHPKAGWENFKEAREAIKLQWLPAWTMNSKGERMRYSRSTADLSNEKFGELLTILTRYIEENFGEILDPEEYKKWRDSAPPPGGMFPQMARLKAKYEEARRG